MVVIILNFTGITLDSLKFRNCSYTEHLFTREEEKKKEGKYLKSFQYIAILRITLSVFYPSASIKRLHFHFTSHLSKNSFMMKSDIYLFLSQNVTAISQFS